MNRKQRRALKRGASVHVFILRRHAHDYEPWYNFKMPCTSANEMHRGLIQHVHGYFKEDLEPYIDCIKLYATRSIEDVYGCSVVQRQEVVVLI